MVSSVAEFAAARILHMAVFWWYVGHLSVGVAVIHTYNIYTFVAMVHT